MKKSCFIVFSIILTICMLFCLFLPMERSYADGLTPDKYLAEGPGASGSSEGIEESFVQKYGGKIAGFLFGIAVLIAVIALMYVGLMFITGGVTQKADYKKTLIPMFIGMAIVALLGTFLKAIAQVAASI